MKNTQSTSTKPGQLRRRLTSSVVALTLVAATMAMTAKPVEAASSVVSCFQPFGSRTAAGLPVLLYALTERGIVEVPGVGTTTDYSGCVWFGVPAAYQRYFLVTYIQYTNYGRDYWSGVSALASPGSGFSWMPVQYVNCLGSLCSSY